jgi:hypothetical protein
MKDIAIQSQIVITDMPTWNSDDPKKSEQEWKEYKEFMSSINVPAIWWHGTIDELAKKSVNHVLAVIAKHNCVKRNEDTVENILKEMERLKKEVLA